MQEERSKDGAIHLLPVLPENRLLQEKYKKTSWFYDILDYPWERMYQAWRPRILDDLHGSVIEVGVGTGRNLPYYPADVEVTGVDLSREMLKRAVQRSRRARCVFHPVCEDAASLESIPSNAFDWLIATFLCCVMPDALHPAALTQFGRVLKPGGRFRLLEILFSNNPRLRLRQKILAPFARIAYGARFDRDVRPILARVPVLKITHTSFLKADTHLLIEGICDK